MKSRKLGLLVSLAVGALVAPACEPPPVSDLPKNLTVPGDYTVVIAAGDPVSFEVRGGGGGSGGWGSQRGGSGTKLTGTIPAQPVAYTLTVNVGGGGAGGSDEVGARGGDPGSSGYAPGARGGHVPDGLGKGSGGGGGGASAIVNVDRGIAVVAPGGGGSGGGAYDTGSANRRGGQGGDLVTGTIAGAAPGDDGGDGAHTGSDQRGRAGSGGGVDAGGTGGAPGTSPGCNGGSGTPATGKDAGRGGNGGACGNVGGGGGGGGGYQGGGGGGGSASVNGADGQAAGGGGSGAAFATGVGTATIGTANNFGVGVVAGAVDDVSGGPGAAGGHGSVVLTIGPTPPSAFSNLNTPAYTGEGAQEVTLSGTIHPAAPARPVSLYAGATYVGGTITDGAGNFSMTATVTDATTFHFYSAPQVDGAKTYSAATSGDFEVRSLRLFDDFDYANATELAAATRNGQPKWKLRGNLAYNSSPKFIHSKVDWDAITLDDTGLVFKIVQDGSDPDDGKPRYKVPQITAGKLDGQVYGHVEARIKFQRPQGPHGALWWQSGYGPGGGEFDVVEWFGRRGAGGPHTQNVQQTYHGPDPENIQRRGNVWTDEALPLDDVSFTVTDWPGSWDTWWTEFHTYSGHWSEDRYYYAIDGVPVGDLGPEDGVTPATIPGDVILNMAISEPHEYAEIEAHLAGGGSATDYKMHVDWIRVWK